MNADADAITNAEMSMPRFPNALASVYRGPLTSKPSKIRPSIDFMIFTVVTILAKVGTTRKMLNASIL